MNHAETTTKHVIDAASIGVWAGAMAEILPAIAAVVSIVWGVIRIYETNTVQKGVRKFRRKKPEEK